MAPNPAKPEQLRIVLYPDPVLKQVSKPLRGVTDEVRAVAQRMLDLMHEARGVGLAAPQVGLSWRLFVANPTGEPQDDRVFINPKLSNPSSQTHTHEEGCLSIPHVTGDITRPLGITVDALDEHGGPVQLTSDELAARIWQHETDHLDGVLILDRMPAIDKVANRQAVLELEDAAGQG
jgi:peptide deformylase